MSENRLRQLAGLGQSAWLDYIHRESIESGELARLIAEDGISGLTSNPTIFDKAIAGGNVYDAALARHLAASSDPEVVFFRVAAEDIRAAADLLRPVYDATQGADGHVSLEVSPELAHDTAGTIAQALELVTLVNRANLLVKVPATAAGLPAIEELTALGVSVNVTLLFAVSRYREVVERWLAGLERRHAAGGELASLASVASFFVSRVDSAVDRELEAAEPALREALRGRAAIANAGAAYSHFGEIVASERFAPLRAAGARPQRLLWASTGTKNPDYPDTLYVDALIGKPTVTTLPPATLAAFREHGRPRETLSAAAAESAAVLAELGEAGIYLATITERLEHEGVDAFLDSYRHLMTTVAQRSEVLAPARAGP